MSRTNVESLIAGLTDGGNNTAAEVRSLLTTLLALVPAQGNAVVNATQDLNAIATAGLTTGTSDSLWSTTATALEYTGTPSYVIVLANIEMVASASGVKPGLRIRRNSAGLIAASVSADPSSNSLKTSITLAGVDVAPGANPNYSLWSNPEGLAGNASVSIGSLTCIAIGA